MRRLIILIVVLFIGLFIFEQRIVAQEINVTATFYNPVKGQCSGNSLITADGSKIDLKKLKNDQIRWIAVSRDLLKSFGFGTKVRIESSIDSTINGVYEVHDTMAKRWRNKIDILQTSDKNKKHPGVIKNVKIKREK